MCAYVCRCNRKLLSFLAFHKFRKSSAFSAVVTLLIVSFCYVTWTNSDVKFSRPIISTQGGGCFDAVSTCSCQADQRGLHQNVVAYSIYGDYSKSEAQFSRYISPLKAIVEQARKFYPGWIVRIYVNSSSSRDPSFEFIQDYLRSYSNVDICNSTRSLESFKFRLDVFPMIWRFLPLLDRLVDRFVSRDADSYITRREFDAVHQWLDGSNATFHVMRDHWLHCAPYDAPMPGGMWGAKVHQRRITLRKAAVRLFTDPRAVGQQIPFGRDQLLLAHRMWKPLAEEDSMVHDSYCCSLFNGTRSFPSPRPTDKDYVGRRHNDPGLPADRTCPLECRPPQYPDWNYC